MPHEHIGFETILRRPCSRPDTVSFRPAKIDRIVFNRSIRLVSMASWLVESKWTWPAASPPTACRNLDFGIAEKTRQEGMVGGETSLIYPLKLYSGEPKGQGVRCPERLFPSVPEDGCRAYRSFRPAARPSSRRADGARCAATAGRRHWPRLRLRSRCAYAGRY